jgi:Ca2+-transporting ATPase
VQQILVRDIVVGDVIELNQGDRVPADCIILEEMNMKVDQSMYNPNETEVDKEESTVNESGHDNHKEHPDPFLFTDSKIVCGQGKAIVCCVGENTILGKTRKPDDTFDE